MVDPSVSGGVKCQLLHLARYAHTITHHIQLGLAIVFNVQRERFFQASVLLLECEKGLMWSRAALPILRGEGDLESIGGAQ